jgi:hypothetical protein
MNKRILVSESEKNSILKMHESFKRGLMMEDDMMGDMTTTTSQMEPPKGKCIVKLSELLKNRTDLKQYYQGVNNDFDYYKQGGFFFTVIGGEAYEQSPGGIAPIRRKNNMTKNFFMNDGDTVSINITDKHGSRGDEYDISCNNGQVTISTLTTTGP